MDKETRDKLNERLRAQAERLTGADIVRCENCRYCDTGVVTAYSEEHGARVENICSLNGWSVPRNGYCHREKMK